MSGNIILGGKPAIDNIVCVLAQSTKLVASLRKESMETRKGSVSVSVKEPNELEEPVAKRELTTREKIILLKASKVHGCRFPPWTAPPLCSDFEQLSDQPLFV